MVWAQIEEITRRMDVHYRVEGQLSERGTGTGFLVQLAAGYERRLGDRVAAQALVHLADGSAKAASGVGIRYHNVGVQIGVIWLVKLPSTARAETPPCSRRTGCG